MPKSLHKLTREQANRDLWMVAVEAIVAETADDEGQHRIKVLIPCMDENNVHDEWVTALMPWVGAAGYGPVNVPSLGSEVLLFGRLGQKHSLFYLSRFNEDYPVPEEFADGARGLKTETKYRLLADLLIEIISQQHVLIKAVEQVDVTANLVRLLGGESEVVRVEPNKLGVLGAAAITRQTLPPPATDLSSCLTLTNAMRQMLISFGFAQ